ncbi:MAG: DUF885 family protein, partial [Gammaproteobacteria bacterium]|nr:DUF885 family protein [Gammaproteobacteria bacterium]
MKNKTILIAAALSFAQLQACDQSSKDVSEAKEINSSKQSISAEPLIVKEIQSVDSVLDQNDEFERFKQQFLTRFWELNPGFGVYVGFYEFDDKLVVPNGAHRAAQRSFYVNELQLLKEFDGNQLSPGNAADLAILEGKLRSFVWYIDEFRDYEWNPAKYNPAGVFGVILNTEYKPLMERLRVISRRLNNIAPFYEAAKNNIKSPTVEHLDLAIQQSAGAVQMFDVLIPDKLKDVDIEESEKVLLSDKLVSAADAVRSYISWLKAKRAEALVPENESATRDFRIGAVLYEKKFKHDVGSDYTAEELYNLALDAKDTLHKQMIEIT